ncbi:phosphoribosylformylglycinamidine cyclo-ligase [Nostoc linckia z18]|uniref:Phosphoribosylformylglycinamidine cyclo-ligase n=2 Tax=Nostoc linckia TaxID=92942 RepID=A0A9Q6EJS9_NOSLI|nr:phosphoribosylformylglycinamidine cyclo-ligase [Nostoc linckia]PHK41790.1 phosphoribosylformylglycinamidine cyclo-ligase [Nostoc linckia z15]PHK45859.1 phosphoribosylformylglycinamidine cyclo-ligase [Nostoc linckia z16]PHJ69073.1 phosphoribosylformylglycinamidine cyclo-ligase [Nostoc linckia z1]PHJ73224.1 phosphoribosylformylglycinamidine cyclo-ligase [Nostoc linckia z3]PHJ78571.1 phosphoribosylformylglycinamidine cyclo-ligase [Nostoc linckia z2]
MDYRDAGVDVEAGRGFVNQIRNLVHSTFRPEVIGGLGGFGGCFQLPGGFQEPVLVSGTDGVGTKLKIAHILNRHDTVGIDLVAMCVNDVLTSGAEPLFFLDYVATGKLDKEQLTDVVAGITSGCKQAGCALLGGETAEMPGFYQVGEYDLAGFCVGIVEKSQMLDGSQVKVGDVAIALASTGVHSNGFSLVRKIVSDGNFSWSDTPELLGGETIGETFLKPTRIYVKPVLAALKAGLSIHGMAHITGGGLPENLPRCLGEGQAIKIHSSSWKIPPVFQWIAEAGEVSPQAMYNTFNMGIAFVLLVSPDEVEQAISHFQSHEIPAFAIGEVITGAGELVGLPV